PGGRSRPSARAGFGTRARARTSRRGLEAVESLRGHVSLDDRRRDPAAQKQTRLDQSSEGRFRETGSSRFAALKADVEEGPPGRASVVRGVSGFPDAVPLRFPHAPHDLFCSVRRTLTPLEGQAVTLEPAFDGEKLPPVSDPRLVPDLPGRVVDREALSDEAVGLLVDLPQCAAAQDDVDARMGDRLTRCANVEDVPVSRPEVEPAIFGRGTLLRRRGIRAGGEAPAQGRAPGDDEESCGEEPRHDHFDSGSGIDAWPNT